MLRRLLSWNRRRKQWRDAHVAAWSGQDSPQASGLSRFQEMLESRLTHTLWEHGLELENRVVAGRSERFIQAELLGGQWRIWIYSDQAEAVGPRARHVNIEQWDALTPDDLASDFLARLMREVESDVLPVLGPT